MARTSILFDLDGTLVDTAADLAWALNQCLGEIGRRAVSQVEVRLMIGGGIAQLVSLGLEATGGPLAAPEQDRLTGHCKRLYEAHVADRSQPFPGVAEALPVLAEAGFAMGVCTNKPEEASRRLLSALGLGQWIAVIVGGDTLRMRKPDPAMAHAVVERLGAPPDTAVLVGDSATDVTLARAAGIPVILVDYGYSAEPAHALGGDAVISSFAELPDLLPTLS
ncbi:MAG: phosphoglycolate phosphatase [Proteobacteria bacterium]|nr:phosphoglycolate phosphatase [Pseudomonadota bacterium]